MKRFQLLALTLLLSAPASLWAKPVEVLIFPAGAIVTEETGAAVVDGTVTLSLPQAADPDSLKVSTLDSAATLSGLQYESVLETTGDYQQLKDRIEATKTQLQTVEDRRLAKASALELWQGPLGEKFQNAEEYRKLAELMLTNSEQLNLEHSQLVREKKEIEKQLRELERKLAEATSRQKRSWSVQVALQGAKGRESLRYSYRVRNADWQPVYSLDARPGEKQIRWDWTANVHQHTAADWREVHLLLATAEPVFTLTPPENVPWIIREAAHYYPAPAPTLARSKVSSAFAPMATEMDMAAEAKPPARQAGTLFDIYDLGRQTILAGESYQLNLRQGSWPASFDYLSRPLQSPQAFLSAKLEFDQLLPLPSGQAAILVEGVFVGKREFSLLEKKFELPFGNDPQIQIKVTPSREAAEEGLFGGDKSQSWQWQLEITNNKNIPVNLRIEDSLPRIEDKRIRLIESRLADAAEEKQLAKWEIELPPGSKKTLEYGYKIRYPAEMQVEFGR